MMKTYMRTLIIICISGFIALHIQTKQAHANEVYTKPFAYPKNIPVVGFNDTHKTFFPQQNTKYLISFWASWCVPCITELKYFIPLKQQLYENGIDLILINVDRRPQTAIPKFMDKHNITYNDFYTTDMYNAMKKFNATGLPITIAVDDQQVLFRYDYSRIRWDDSLLQSIITGFNQ